MAKPEWGQRHVCQSCAAAFYDMSRTPAVCPKCDTEVVLVSKRRRPSPAKSAAPKAKPADDNKTDEDDELDGIDDVEDIEDDDEDDDDLIEDTSDLGEDDDDMSEVKEHIDLGVEDKE